MSIFCRGRTLDTGFLEIAPPSSATPHPFILYDVTEEDWHWFLYTVKIAASLSPLNRIAAGAVPMALGLGLFGLYMVISYVYAYNSQDACCIGAAVSPMIERTIKKHKGDSVADLINHWNAVCPSCNTRTFLVVNVCFSTSSIPGA